MGDAVPPLPEIYLYVLRPQGRGVRPDSLVLIIAGYFVSLCATAALGVDGTYFGIELGVVKADYKFVTKFPYNVLPHPMILGQVVALLGLHVVPQVGAARPYLIPIHVAL